MSFNEYALEQMVRSRLAEARAAAGREAICRALREEYAARPGWRSRLRAFVAGWRGSRPGVSRVPPTGLSPREAP